jgi:hypothetical protein
VCAARHVIQEERDRRVDVVQLRHPVDGVIGHRRGQVPFALLSDKRINRRGVAEKVRLPLAGVATDEAVKIFKPHPGRPLIERPRLACLIGRCVVVLAEPGCAVAILKQDAADRGVVPTDHTVITGVAGGGLRNHAEAHRVVVTSSDQRRPCGRTQRSRMEVDIAQATRSNAVKRRRRDHAAERRRRGKADVIRHDQQNIRCSLRRHDPR